MKASLEFYHMVFTPLWYPLFRLQVDYPDLPGFFPFVDPTLDIAVPHEWKRKCGVPDVIEVNTSS